MARPTRYSPEIRERAVRMVQEHGPEHASQWAAIESIASKIGCTGETLRKWVRQAERDAGLRAGPTTDERAELKRLQREAVELKRANEILRKASALMGWSASDQWRRIGTEEDPHDRSVQIAEERG
jgi:transposase